MAESPRQDLTQILQAAGAGDAKAAAELLPLVYAALRRLAKARMAKIPPGNTLQPTALVHEAYLRIVGKDDPNLSKSRRHFFAAASRAMRDILVEQVRDKGRIKRGGGRRRVDMDSENLVATEFETPAEDFLALDEALHKLEHDDPSLVQLVNMRFFAGLTSEETASALGVSVSTVHRRWRSARAVLYTQLRGTELE